jgi:hypothetical protein
MGSFDAPADGGVAEVSMILHAANAWPADAIAPVRLTWLPLDGALHRACLWVHCGAVEEAVRSLGAAAAGRDVRIRRVAADLRRLELRGDPAGRALAGVLRRCGARNPELARIEETVGGDGESPPLPY